MSGTLAVGVALIAAIGAVLLIAITATRGRLLGKFGRSDIAGFATVLIVLVGLTATLFIVLQYNSRSQRDTTVAITSPRDQEPVSIQPEIKGTIQNYQPERQELWIFVKTVGFVTDLYFPQNASLRFSRDQWSATGIFVGGTRDKNKSFEILAVLAAPEAQGFLDNYLRTGDLTNSFPGLTRLPNATIVAAQVTVSRR